MISKNIGLEGKIIVHPSAIIEENVLIGKNSTISAFCIIKKNAIIGENCTISAFCEIRENVKIGNNCSFGSRCTISANAVIGDNVIIKYGFVLADTPNLKDQNNKKVGHIGSGVLIGANVTLMPGFSVGDNSIVGACSQIRDNIKENEIWYGNPAKFFKLRN
jgi:UDP-2-acetamido-3-amino-2,3-dideoxy-glucuronate N-acetyltransferase